MKISREPNIAPLKPFIIPSLASVQFRIWAEYLKKC